MTTSFPNSATSTKAASAGGSAKAAPVKLFNFAALAVDVRMFREVLGISYKEISQESGVQASHLTNLTRNDAGLSVDNVLRLCDWLGTEVNDYRYEGQEAEVSDRRGLARKRRAKVQEVMTLAQEQALKVAAEKTP